MFKRKVARFFRQFLRSAPEDYAPEFEYKHLTVNLLRSLYVVRICLFFFFPLLILNILRWLNGDFQTQPVYAAVMFSHLLLGVLFYPYGKITANRERINRGEFSTKQIRELIFFTMTVVSISLCVISAFAVYERNSLAPYAILLIFINYIIVPTPKPLFWATLLIFIYINAVAWFFGEKNPVQMSVFFTETSVLTVAVYLGAVLQYNQQIMSFLYEKKLERQKVLIEDSLTEKYEREIAETQMTALRAQMNPHFLFNALNSIKLYVVSNDSKTAARYLTKFSKLIRSILSNSKSKMVPVAAEVEALELYIQMEQFRFNFKFDYTIEIDDDVDKDFTEIPPMLMQPYVENAIWHGLMYKTDDKGMLRVCIRHRSGRLEFIIEDNGIGRTKSVELKSKITSGHKSVGMQITADRLAMNNRLYGIEGKLEIIDKKYPDGSAAGTKIIFSLPYEV